MNQYFLNGGGPTYPGVAVTNAEQLATQIRNVLVTELGWDLVSGSPTSLPMRIRSNVAKSGIKCFFEFANHTSGLSVQAIDGSTLAPAIGTSTNQMAPWVIDTTSRCHISANEEAWIIRVTNNTSTCVTIYGGWPAFVNSNRAVPANSWALGRLCAINATTTNTGTSGYAGVIFRNASGTQFAALPIGANANILVGAGGNTTTVTNGRTTFVEISPNYHRTPTGEYNGNVQFACTGLSGASPGSIHRVNTGLTTRYYLACGIPPSGLAGEAGFYVDEVNNP